MASEWELKQAAIDALHAMLRSHKPRKFSNAKAEIALGVLEEMREAKEQKIAPLRDFVQDIQTAAAAEVAISRAMRGIKDKDED